MLLQPTKRIPSRFRVAHQNFQRRFGNGPISQLRRAGNNPAGICPCASRPRRSQFRASAERQSHQKAARHIDGHAALCGVTAAAQRGQRHSGGFGIGPRFITQGAAEPVIPTALVAHPAPAESPALLDPVRDRLRWPAAMLFSQRQESQIEVGPTHAAVPGTHGQPGNSCSRGVGFPSSHCAQPVDRRRFARLWCSTANRMAPVGAFRVPGRSAGSSATRAVTQVLWSMPAAGANRRRAAASRESSCRPRRRRLGLAGCQQRQTRIHRRLGPRTAADIRPAAIRILLSDQGLNRHKKSRLAEST